MNKCYISKRLDFAKENLITDWSSVCFSDEKKWNLDGPDGYNNYWHDKRTQELFKKQRQMRGGGVMVWAGIWADGKTDIVFIDGNINSEKYIKVLEGNLLPHQHKFTIFQQNNAPIHNSKMTSEWLIDNDISVVTWPPCSPDLNPIENLWGILTQRVYKNNTFYSNVQELKDAIMQAWDGIGEDILRTLSTSMNNRIFNLILKKGCHIK